MFGKKETAPIVSRNTQHHMRPRHRLTFDFKYKMWLRVCMIKRS